VTGFKTSSEWAPREFLGEMPSNSDFEDFVKRREPFVTRTSQRESDKVTSLDSALGWTVQQWSDKNYIRNKVGEENVLIEKLFKDGIGHPKFGFSSGVYKRKISFASFMDSNFGNSGVSGEFLNLQEGYFRDGKWNSPLHKLKSDVPVPLCLKSREDNLTSVNLWMSNVPEGQYNLNIEIRCEITFTICFHCPGSTHTTRLHMDPMDSLYVVVAGQKTFTLYSPDKTPNLETLSPTYGVSPDGFSFQYNSPANLPSLDNRQVQGHELGKGHYHYSSKSASDLQDGIVVELSAGDVLFVPAGWYHEVSF
jgi:oxalate decarboxylase/phosphoglucose isomerase-like protein (cupin superfamily)